MRKEERKGTKAKQHCSRGGMAKSQRFQESISANRIVHAPRAERNTTTASLLAINNNVSFVCLLKTIVAHFSFHRLRRFDSDRSYLCLAHCNSETILTIMLISLFRETMITTKWFIYEKFELICEEKKDSL